MNKPTEKQANYLNSLCDKLGIERIEANSIGEASSEIKRLKANLGMGKPSKVKRDLVNKLKSLGLYFNEGEVEIIPNTSHKNNYSEIKWRIGEHYSRFTATEVSRSEVFLDGKEIIVDTGAELSKARDKVKTILGL